MNIAVYGSGIAAILAAKYFNCPIYVPEGVPIKVKHDAIMRFKTPDVLNILGIPQKQVTIRKAIATSYGLEERADIELCNRYSLKVSGSLTNRSIYFEHPIEKRYVAETDLIESLQGILSEHVACELKCEDLINYASHNKIKFINTTPLTIYDKNVSKDKTVLSMVKKIFVAKYFIPIASDVYQTIYCPQDDLKTYRASIEPYNDGTLMRVEMVDVDGSETFNSLSVERDIVLAWFGLENLPKNEIRCVSAAFQAFGKLNTSMIDENVRKLAILRLTKCYGLYSFGRYGTMRSIGLDSLVNDLKVIGKLIKMDEYNCELYGSNNYEVE